MGHVLVTGASEESLTAAAQRAGWAPPTSLVAVILPDECVDEVEQSWGGDDFAWFTREVPGTYVRLGVRDPDGPTLDLHAGHFDIDERAIAIGVQLLAATVEQYFATHTES